MKFWIVLLISVFAIASIPQATGQVGSHIGRDRYKAQKPKKANQSFHYFATCMARKYHKHAANWISNSDWQAAQTEIAKKAKNSGCVRDLADHKFRAHESLLRGGFAEGLFERNWKKNKITPAFLGLPRLVTTEQVDAAANSKEKSKLLIAAFSECTAKNATSHVVRLLQSRPSTDEEQAVFTSLGPVMSACVPVADGGKLSFSKIALRSGLAEATYKLYELQLAEASSQQTVSEASN